MALRILTLLMVLMPCCARAADIGVEVKNILAKEDYSPQVIQISSGALDARGLYHIAIVMDSRDIKFVYFIKGAADGRPAEVLGRVDIGGPGRTLWDVDIKKKSIFISNHASGGCCSHNGETYQFKLNAKKQLVMIGYEVLSQESMDGRVFFEDNLSLNLITGEVIKFRTESNNIELWSERTHFKPPLRMYKLLPPSKKETRRFRIQVPKQWSLQNLDVSDDEFSDWKQSWY
jgi:hypothetical protein